MKEDIKDFKQALLLVLKICGFMLATGIIMVTTLCIGFKVIAFIIKLFGLL